MTPEFVEAHTLDISPLSDLVDGTVGINSFGGLFSQPVGIIIVRVQVEGVRGYNEDQVDLVIPDSTNFGTKGIKFVQLVAANAEPQVEVALETLEKLDKIQGIQ